MKKKGFTLIELLAVIVVLAVIALITVPTILGVIEKARRSSLQDSGYGLLEAANLYYAQYSPNKTVRFDIKNNKMTTEEENNLTYKGNVKKGTVLINNKGKVTVCINDGKHAAYKNYQDTKITIVDFKTCTIPENDYIVYLNGESTIKEMSNQELTDAVKNLVNQVNQLKQQINNKSDQSQATNIQVKHDQDVTSIWNKVGKEDISSIGTNISSTLIDQNNKLTNLQDLVNGKVDATVTNNLASQISSLSNSVNNHTIQIANNNNDINTLKNKDYKVIANGSPGSLTTSISTSYKGLIVVIIRPNGDINNELSITIPLHFIDVYHNIGSSRLNYHNNNEIINALIGIKPSGGRYYITLETCTYGTTNVLNNSYFWVYANTD